jgi:hypothetical protein
MTDAPKWIEFSEASPTEIGWYVVNLVCDDGDGRVDQWTSIDKWDGKHFLHYLSAVYDWYGQRCETFEEAKSLCNKVDKEEITP